MHHRKTYMHINFHQNLVSRSVKTVHTNLFAKKCKLHKFATTNSNFEKKTIFLDMHHHKTSMYINFQQNQVKTQVMTVHTRVGVKYSTCTWYLYLSTYLSVLDVLEYLVYGNVKVLVLVLVLDQKVLGTWQVIFKYYLLRSVKVANYLNTLL